MNLLAMEDAVSAKLICVNNPLKDVLVCGPRGGFIAAPFSDREVGALDGPRGCLDQMYVG